MTTSSRDCCRRFLYWGETTGGEPISMVGIILCYDIRWIYTTSGRALLCPQFPGILLWGNVRRLLRIACLLLSCRITSSGRYLRTRCIVRCGRPIDRCRSGVVDLDRLSRRCWSCVDDRHFSFLALLDDFLSCLARRTEPLNYCTWTGKQCASCCP